MVTIGRVLAAVVSSRVPARWIYLGLPMLLVVAFLAISQVSTALGGLLAFGLVRSGLFGIFPTQYQFWRRRISPLNRCRLRRIDCLLPGWLWDRRFWDRMAPGSNPFSLVVYLRGRKLVLL